VSEEFVGQFYELRHKNIDSKCFPWCLVLEADLVTQTCIFAHHFNFHSYQVL